MPASHRFRLTHLPSGARVITAPMLERASVGIAVMFGVGSRHEESRLAGLAHFIEHIVFKGSRLYPTAQAISETMEGMGGALNASTDKEMTAFWVKVPAAKMEQAWAVLSDMLFAPIVDATEVAKEQQVVVEELRMYQDNPQEHVHVLFDEVMWPKHPLGGDIAGTEETVRALTRDDCVQRLQRYYRPGDAVVSIAGAMGHDSTLSMVTRSFAEYGGAAQSGVDNGGVPGVVDGRLRVVDKKTEQANIVVGARGVSYRDNDRFVMDVLNGILGEGMSSRLFLELREKRALAYDVHSFASKHSDTGSLAMYIGCEPAQAMAALTAAIDELQRLAEERVPESELRKVRDYTTLRLAVHLEGTNALSQYLGQQEVLCDEILTVENVTERIAAVTADDVQRLARTVMNNGLRAAVVGPFHTPDAFAAALEHVPSTASG